MWHVTSELHTELAELTRDAENWMKRTSTSPNRDPCMSPMLIRKGKRMRKIPKAYQPDETSAGDDFTDSNETAVSSSPESDLGKLQIMPTLAVQVPQLGWTCSKRETAHLCHQSDKMQCSTCGAGNQRARSMETFVAWLEAYGFGRWTQWAASCP